MGIVRAALVRTDKAVVFDKEGFTKIKRLAFRILRIFGMEDLENLCEVRVQP